MIIIQKINFSYPRWFLLKNLLLSSPLLLPLSNDYYSLSLVVQTLSDMADLYRLLHGPCSVHVRGGVGLGWLVLVVEVSGPVTPLLFYQLVTFMFVNVYWSIALQTEPGTIGTIIRLLYTYNMHPVITCDDWMHLSPKKEFLFIEDGRIKNLLLSKTVLQIVSVTVRPQLVGPYQHYIPIPWLQTCQSYLKYTSQGSNLVHVPHYCYVTEENWYTKFFNYKQLLYKQQGL